MLKKVLAAAIITYTIILFVGSFFPDSADVLLVLMIPLVCLIVACTDFIIQTIEEHSNVIIQKIEESSNRSSDKD